MTKAQNLYTPTNHQVFNFYLNSSNKINYFFFNGEARRRKRPETGKKQNTGGTEQAEGRGNVLVRGNVQSLRRYPQNHIVMKNGNLQHIYSIN